MSDPQLPSFLTSILSGQSHVQDCRRQPTRVSGFAPFSERADPDNETSTVRQSSFAPLMAPVFSTPVQAKRGEEKNPFEEQGEEEEERDNPENSGPEEPTDPSDLFIKAMTKLSDAIGGLKSSSKHQTKLWAPNKFDGKKPHKLCEFLVMVQLNLNANPEAYDTYCKRIHYVLAYLTSPAMDWFEPEILYGDLKNPPAWSVSFDAFIEELSMNFRPFDPVGEAEIRLGELQMKDSDRITQYNTSFN